MNPTELDAHDHLNLAQVNLDEAEKILGVNLPSVAARSAYYAAYHAAEAYIIAKTGKCSGGHDKARSQFGLLVKDDPRFDLAVKKFLGTAYKYKDIGDYGLLEKRIEITIPLAREAINSATRFVATVESCIAVTESNPRTTPKISP